MNQQNNKFGTSSTATTPASHNMAMQKFNHVTPEMGLQVIKATGSLKKLESFIVAIEQLPVPVVDIENLLKPLGGAKKAAKDGFDIDGINGANTKMASTFAKLQQTCKGLSDESIKAWDVLNNLGQFASTSKLYITAIFQLYQNKGKISAPERSKGINLSIHNINQDLTTFLESIKPATSSFNNYQEQINNLIGDLKTCMTDIASSVPTGDGAKIDLSNITEVQANADLDKQLKTLNSNANSISSKIEDYTIAAVAATSATCLLAIPELLSGPIGWMALGGEIYGDVELVKQVVKEKEALAEDKLKIQISEAEKLIVQPYFAMKQYVAYLDNMNSAFDGLSIIWSGVQTDLNNIEKDNSEFQKQLGTISIPDVPILGPEGDYYLLCGNPNSKLPNEQIGLYGQLEELISKLTGATYDKPAIKPNFTQFIKQEEWDAIYNSPDAPFYIKGLKSTYNV